MAEGYAARPANEIAASGAVRLIAWKKAKPRRQAGLRLPALVARLAIEIARILAALRLAGR
jgi:hypothetical protein